MTSSYKASWCRISPTILLASISKITVKSVPIFDMVKGATIQLNVKIKLLRDYEAI